MKRFLFALCLVALITGCSKDDESSMPTNSSIGVDELVEYIGKSPQYVKDNFKDGKLVDEGGTLGKTDLTYQYKTHDGVYGMTFSSNTANEMVSITVWGDFDTYSEGVEVYKKEMDLIDESIDYVTYAGWYNDKYIGIVSFSDRKEFWDYVAEKDVNKSVREIWWLVNESTQKFTVEGMYDKESGRIIVLIENNMDS